MPSSDIALDGNEPVPAARLASFYFAYYAALGAFVPYWSLFLKGRGQDAAAISVLMSLWYGTRIFAPSAWGWFAGRSPQPIRWLRIGCALTLAAFLVFLLPLDFRGLLIAMCVFCFAYNAVMPQFEALTFSHLPGRSERYGRIRVWGSIGYIVTVVGFGIVFDHWPIGYLPLLLAPLFLVLLLSSFSNDYGRPRADEVPLDQGFRQRLRLPEVRVFFIVALLAQISFGAYYTFFSIYLAQHGYRTSALGAYWAVAVAVEIAVFVFSVRIFGRWSARSIVIASLLSAWLRWWVTALWPDNVVLMALAQLTHALNFAGFYAACMMLMARYFPGRMNGHGQGIFYGFSSGLGGVVGALLAGQTWHFGAGRGAFLICGAIALLAAILAWHRLDRPGVPSLVAGTDGQ